MWRDDSFDNNIIGKMYFKDGDVYEGEWLFDKFHGKGIFTQKGNVFEGIWNKGAGKGTMTFHIDKA